MSDEQEFFIAGFQGVNVVRARSLLEKFGSPMEIISQMDDWLQIPGIGKKTLASAKKLLYAEYEKQPDEEESPEEDKEET